MDSEQFNSLISVDRSGEMNIKADIIKNITRQLCNLFNCKDINEARPKIRKLSKIRIKTPSGYYSEVFSVSKGIVKSWTRSLSLVAVPGLYSDLDLEKGKYEGGFKVWESTRDLVKFLTEDQTVMSEILNRNNQFRCLEVGGGACLPTLALISRIIQDPNFKSHYSFHVQDYNWQVLASLTLLNFVVNFPSDYLAALIDTRCLRLYHGDWKDFSTRTRYDLIMMSEVIYNYDNYDSLHNLLERHLATRGYIVIATKETYFGLTGSLYTWLDFVVSKNVFLAQRVIRVSSNNIPRSILIMRRIMS